MSRFTPSRADAIQRGVEARAHQLHPDTALRVLRAELLRLNDSRPELMEAMDDPRLPAGVARDQLNQTDAEIHEIVEAIRVLEAHWEAKTSKGAAGMISGYSMAQIIEMVAWEYRISIDAIRRGVHKGGKIRDARQAAMWRMRSERYEDGRWRWSLKQVGKNFGLRDHTSVLNGVKQHERRVALKEAA